MPQCLTALTIGVGMNQIVETFGFGEIELAVLERTAGEQWTDADRHYLVLAAKLIEPRVEIVRAYNDELQARLGKTVWATGCKSWYLTEGGFNATMSDWALRDMAGALDALAARFPSLPLRWLGHSFGGQVVGVVPGIERCVRIATIATSIGRWQWQASPRKYGAALWWHVVGPYDLATKGHAGRNAIWQGKPLPAGVFRQWKRWCASPRYFAIDVGGALGDGYFDRLRSPIRALCFTDDWIATRRNVAALHALYEKPGVQATWLSPRDAGVPRIDHEGAFLRGNAAVWPHVAALLA